MKSVKIEGFYWPADVGEHYKASLKRIQSLLYINQFWHRKRVVVQAGGSYGIWPYYLSKHFKLVYSFEPDWISFYYLTLNCPMENVIKLQAALSDTDKGLSIKRKSFTGHLVNDLGYIPGLRIDTLRLLSCDALLLDVEGYEYQALEGAKHTIREFKPIILFEDRPGFAEYHGRKSIDAVKFVEKEGYRLVADIHCDKIYVHKDEKFNGPVKIGKGKK